MFFMAGRVRYYIDMTKDTLHSGVVHSLPADLKDMILSHPQMKTAWEDITPLARNEFICWVTAAKKPETRLRRIEVARSKLMAGQRRPCCWEGCDHRDRTGKA